MTFFWLAKHEMLFSCLGSFPYDGFFSQYCASLNFVKLGSCEHSNEPSCPLQGGEFLDHLLYCLCLKKISAEFLFLYITWWD